MIASLPMYDRPEFREVTDRYWRTLRDALGTGPDTLTRDGDVWAHWLSPELVLSQTCGYPYRARLHGQVTLIGTPDYSLPGCPPGHYNSVFVVRRDDPRDALEAFSEATFAYNEPLSQSGWAAPQNYARSKGFTFTNTVQTGGHQVSAQAVADARADIAALDALSWLFMQRYDDFAQNLRVIDQTPPTPTLPYITALGEDGAQMFNAVSDAISGLSVADRETLSLSGFVSISSDAYLAVPNPPPPA